MPPRKKTSATVSSSSSSSSSSHLSSSKKSNPNQTSQRPSKFGIQHFFERHSQNQNHKANPNPPKPPPPTSRQSLENPRPSDSDTGRNPGKGPVVSSSSDLPNEPSRLDLREPEEGRRSKTADPNNNPSQNTPPNNLAAVATDADEKEPMVSPEPLSKSVSVKRLKFSPRMLIKQSQDDGGDEITWKISPVNERLQAMSKHMPDAIRTLADASRMSFLNFQQCSQKKDSSGLVGKLEHILSSPQHKCAADTALVAPNRVGLKRVHSELEMASDGNAADMVCSGRPDEQSPFRTPPSLSYCHEKSTDGVACNGASSQLNLRQHKKALLELLDQVEDVITVEDSITNGSETCFKKPEDKINDRMTVKGPAINLPRKVNWTFNGPGFLVLEVSEMFTSTDSFGASCRYKVLRILNEHSGEERAVHLWDEWFYSVVSPGDTINVVGEFNEGGKCHVDCKNNLLIIHPDVLVSGTRVAASFSCPRRAVLDERLKTNEHSTAALIGTLLHQIFQAALIKESPTKEFLDEYTRTVVQKNVESLYACGVNETDMLKTMIEGIPKILNWIKLFKGSQDSNCPPMVDFGSDDGAKIINISEVVDIEEMAWAPKYGLKGMIDASLRVKIKLDAGETVETLVPLEFKTGKSTSGQSAMEHSAQVILYTLLMSERYLKHIDSGLLYYLHTDQTKGIPVRRSDLIGLIMRRNELANDILKASTMQKLPPMLQSLSTCRGCRHLNVCTVYHKVHGGSAESSGLGDVFESCVKHLTEAHSAFLRQWDHLIDLEAIQIQVAQKEIWHPQSSEHDCSANCLSSIILDAACEVPLKQPAKENQFIYRFLRQNSHNLDVRANETDPLSDPLPSTDDTDCALRAGDYVILSTKFNHVAVARGVIYEISRFHVLVTFSKRLRLPSSYPSPELNDILQEIWRIDKDEFSSSFALMRFNLVQLFLEDQKSSHLRKMIVDLEVPRFDSGCILSQDPAISYIWSEKKLNNDQRRAILKILTAKDYALILGMPGTGKTSTMVHAVKAFLMRGASILLTSYTNSAIDNLLIKLKAQNIDFVRIGRNNVVHEEVQNHCFSGMNIHKVEDIKLRMDLVRVVAVTCLGINSPLLASRRFDVCIMDEAGQTTLPVSLGPLMFASTFVLVGDHYQLPPLVQSAEARESEMGISLFCRLSKAHPHAISALQSQYRMCQGIMELSNTLIYDDRLCCGSSEVANAKLKLSGSKSSSSWLQNGHGSQSRSRQSSHRGRGRRVTSRVLDPKRPVIFINTDALLAFEKKDCNTVNNPFEANIVAEVIEELVSHGIDEEDIGIITPYNSQTNIIRHAVHMKSVEIHTIDKYQGRDKDCILVSFVRSTENPRNHVSSLLGDWHRINVALTRAKKKLIMVGSSKTLSKVPLLKLLIENVEKQSGILNLSRTDVKQKGC